MRKSINFAGTAISKRSWHEEEEEIGEEEEEDIVTN
jgi:hypothetical protein